MPKASAAGVVTLTSLTVLTVGVGKSVVVEKELPPFRFFLATSITAVTLASIAMISENAGKGVSLIVLIVVGIDELPPLLKALDGNPDMGVKDFVEQGPQDLSDTKFKGLDTNPALLGKPKTKTKTTKKVTP